MPTTAPVVKRFYPTLDTVISEQDIPEILGFIRNGLVSLLEEIHFKDLQVQKSASGDAAFYSLQIVSPRKLAIEIPGTGIALVLNPDLAGDTTISAFPITVEYEWKVLGYLKAFKGKNFSFQPQEIFEMALLVLNLTEEQVLANFINTFVTPQGNNTSLQQFIADINAEDNSLNIVTPSTEAKIKDVAQSIQNAADQYPALVAFGTYILDNDINTTLNKLKTFFKSLLPNDIDAYIKDILIPKFRATLTLIAAVEFPRNLLQPVYRENGTNPYGGANGEPLSVIPADSNGSPKVLLTFAEALFYADTERGFGYSMELVLNTPAPAQIGNTGLIFTVQNLKLDLSQETNIPEADADGRPVSFMGFYTDELDIYLPKKWFKEQNGVQQTLKLFGRRLLIGSGGGISGTIGLEALDLNNPIDENDYLKYELGENSGFKIGFNKFDITFKQNKVVNSNIRAMLEIPKLDQPIEIQGTLDSDFNTQIAA